MEGMLGQYVRSPEDQAVKKAHWLAADFMVHFLQGLTDECRGGLGRGHAHIGVQVWRGLQHIAIIVLLVQQGEQANVAARRKTRYINWYLTDSHNECFIPATVKRNFSQAAHPKQPGDDLTKKSLRNNSDALNTRFNQGLRFLKLLKWHLAVH